MKYLLLRTDATTEILEPVQPLQLADFQKLVGGYIEYVRIARSNLVAIVNEEGCLTGLPANPFFETDIVGDAVLVFHRPGDDEPRGFPDEWIEPLKLWFQPIGQSHKG